MRTFAIFLLFSMKVTVYGSLVDLLVLLKLFFSRELSNEIWKNDIREIPTVVYPVCFFGIPNSASVTAAPGSSKDLEL